MLRKLSLLPYLVSVIVVLAACENKHPTQNEHSFDNIFSGDSGYLSEKVMLPYILSENLLDTASPSRSKTALSDSVIMGKYYRKDDHYIVCVLHPDEPSRGLILFETTPEGHASNMQLYGHGIYNNCWGDGVFAFGKTQDYFYLITCRTGSAYTGKERYLFKSLHSQEEIASILDFSWNGSLPSAEIDFQQLSSQLNISHDSLFADYKLEQYIRDKQAGTGVGETIDSFKVVYVMKEGKWAATDSTHLRLFLK